MAEKAEKPKKQEVGEVVHYYPHPKAGIVKLSKALKIGDKISIEGPVTNIQQTVDSMEIEHEKIEAGKKGQEVGILIEVGEEESNNKIREKDKVFKI